MSAVPGHPGKQESHSASAGDAGEEETATDDEWQDREPRIHRERQDRACCGKRADDDLNLPHERKYTANAAVDRKSGVDPGLRAALDQRAIVTSGTLQLLDGLARPRASLAENIDRGAGLVPREKGIDPELIERD